MSENDYNQEPPKELTTVADFIRWGASLFNRAGLHYGHGTDNAHDEAQWLVLHALSLESPLPEPLYSARLAEDERAAVMHLLQERVRTRRPAAYMIGEARFAGLKFHVNEYVLVPRSPVAELIESGFEPWLEAHPVRRVADLCTGSGCIAVACALVFPEARVWATDIDPHALSVAEQNVARYDLDQRVELRRGDLYADLPADGGFELIVANPPYVDAGAMARLPDEYRHEPEVALAGGESGLDFAERIIRRAADYLSPEGLLVLEVGRGASALESRFPDLPMSWPEFERGGFGVCLIHAADLGVLEAPEEGDRAG